MDLKVKMCFTPQNFSLGRTDFTVGTLKSHFFIRNSFIRNLYWDGQIAKKLSVLRPQGLRNFCFFFHFQYHNFEDTVTNVDLNEYHI